jgi:pimeloyl-ACP methyl ester carboxylesterase
MLALGIAIAGLVGIAVVYLVTIGLVLDLSVPPEPLEHRAGDDDSGPPVPRTEVRFEVDGTSLHAWLFLPEPVSTPVACIVMAHGFGGTKDAGLARYAARYREAGFAVLAFDYRHFGESEGEPRQLYLTPYQLADWAAAVAYTRGLAQVDPERIALWGSSASGGHVVVTAAKDARIACVSAQCPGLDPRTDGRALAKRIGIRGMLRLVMHAQRDLVRSRLGLSAHRIPIVAPPGSFAFLNAPDAYEGYSAIAPEGFRNEVCARIVLRSGGYSPIEDARDLRCPVLIQVCEQDSLASPASASETAERLGKWAEVKRYPIGHFDIYRGEWFETAVRDQVEFFRKHL